MVASLQLQREAIEEVIRKAEPLPPMNLLSKRIEFVLEGFGFRSALHVLGISRGKPPFSEEKILVVGFVPNNQSFSGVTTSQIQECSYVVLLRKGDKEVPSETPQPGVTYRCIVLLKYVGTSLLRISEEEIFKAVVVLRSTERIVSYAVTICG